MLLAPHRIVVIISLITLGFAMVTHVKCKERLAGPVVAKIVKFVDGNIIVVRVKIWLGQEIETEVRLDDIDTPELRGKCPGNASWPSRPAIFRVRALTADL